MMNAKRILILLTVIGALAAGVWVAAFKQGPSTELLYGLSFDDSKGKPFALASLKGKPVVINFWATWCAPCIEEMPELNAWHVELAGKAEIIGIGIDSAANITQFSEKSPVRYPLLVAGMGGTELSRLLGNASSALPYTLVIDTNGMIRHTVLGRFNLAELKGKMAPLLIAK
jgi:thiol-disulfide isomerase/thioredoxin